MKFQNLLHFIYWNYGIQSFKFALLLYFNQIVKKKDLYLEKNEKPKDNHSIRFNKKRKQN